MRPFSWDTDTVGLALIRGTVSIIRFRETAMTFQAKYQNMLNYFVQMPISAAMFQENSGGSLVLSLSKNFQSRRVFLSI